MTDFARLIGEWATFYQLTGTAAATLIGLLFVAVSINIETFRGRARLDLQYFATLTFNCFFYVLLISMLFLVPRLAPAGMGVPLALLGALGLINALLQRRRANQLQADQRSPRIASRFTAAILGLLGLTLFGLGVILQITESLYGLVVVVVFLLGSASVNAWTLLVRADEQALAESPSDE